MASNTRTPETLTALFEASCARRRARPAFTSMGVTLTYGDVERSSARFGAFLRQELALAPYKRPLGIEFRDALPKSPLRKVLHRELKTSA
jgi:acyl-CoA synthetase (AMP-forming)/AMP-acid ligase II